MAAHRTWIRSLFVDLADGGNLVLPASQWQDVSTFSDLVLTLEFTGTGGASLVVSAQTTPETNPDAAVGGGWLQMGTLTMSSSPKILVVKGFASVPPMGLARLGLTASGGAVTGALRAFLLLKRPSASWVSGTSPGAWIDSVLHRSKGASCCGPAAPRRRGAA